MLYDNEGRRRGQLLNLESFLHPDVAAAADVRSLEKQAKWQKGLTPWDIGSASLKHWCRHQLKLDAYLMPDKKWSSESLQEFRETALRLSPQIKAALNFTVTPEMSAVQILNQLLGQMGVECAGKQVRKGGRSHSNLCARAGVLAAERRNLRAKKISSRSAFSRCHTPPSLIIKLLGGVTLAMTLKSPN